MSIRNLMRRSLLNLDSRLGMREWLRQDNGAGDESARPQPSDPFAISELQHPRPNTVLDIGANNGQFAEEVFRAFPNVTVYSFEPIPECYERLLRLREQQPTLHPIPLALSNHDGEVEFWLSHFRDSSSIQEMLPTHTEAWPHTKIEAKITVQVARLDSMAQGLDIKPPVFAKLDVQGHEMAVIEGGKDTLQKCERVMIECNFAPLYKGQPSFTELYEALRSLGFLFDGFLSPLRHPKTFELVSSDAIFYRPTS